MDKDNSEEMKKKIKTLRTIDWKDEDICHIFKLTPAELIKLSGTNLWGGG